MEPHLHRTRTVRALASAAVLLTLGCPVNPLPRSERPPIEGAPDTRFSPAERVPIQGYTGDVMEPFLTRDGGTLLFNDRNDPDSDADLYRATLAPDGGFTFAGPLVGANSSALDGVATADREGVLYFVSPRSYRETLSVIHRGKLRQDGTVSDVEVLPGISWRMPGVVNFDVDVSPDGATLYFVDAWFGRRSVPQSADLVIARRSGEGFVRDPRSARVLENVNSNWLEYAPCIREDGLELFFTRVEAITREAEPRIYVARRPHPDAPFGPPERVAAAEGFVEGAALSPDGRSLYFHRREEGRFRLYRARRAEAD